MIADTVFACWVVVCTLLFAMATFVCAHTLPDWLYAEVWLPQEYEWRNITARIAAKPLEWYERACSNDANERISWIHNCAKRGFRDNVTAMQESVQALAMPVRRYEQVFVACTLILAWCALVLVPLLLICRAHAKWMEGSKVEKKKKDRGHEEQKENNDGEEEEEEDTTRHVRMLRSRLNHHAA